MSILNRLALALTLLMSLGTSWAAESTGTPTSAAFSPMSMNSAILPNPDRGAADWAGSDFVTQFDINSVKSAYSSKGRRLFYCWADLAAFRNSAISSAWLSTFQTNLNTMRANGAKCMMLLGYDITSGSGNDATAAQIVAHTAQLRPYLRANADVIPYAKAGFVGAYAQWFGSKNGNTCGYASPVACPNASVAANKVIIRDAILAAYHPYTQVGVPYPDDLYSWNKTPVSAQQAFNGSTQARIGMENDCPLSTGGGNTDSGSFLDKLGLGVSQSQLMAYAQQVSEWIAYFGEFSDSCSPQVTDCPSALSYLATYHGAAFKLITSDMGNYERAWTAGGCFTRIQNQLGYWMQLDSVTHAGTASPGQSVTVKALMRNLGWARMFSPRRLVATACLSTAPTTCYTGTSSSDMRSLPPQATGSSGVHATIDIPASAPKGTYVLSLSLPDVWSTTQARPFMVRFANSNSGAQVWNDTAGSMATGTSIVVN